MWGFSSMLFAAFALDLLLGDPKQWPHPVRWMGTAATVLETLSRRHFRNLKVAGVVTVATLATGTYALIATALGIADGFHPALHWCLETVLIYTTLSMRGLYDESRPVRVHLKDSNLRAARESLSWIVGRDTARLDEKEIIRATVETVAENTVDGVIAPLFYACIGGAPLALAYKCINTLDSMFGYRNEKYREFGWASARLDDAANWIPARIGGLLLVLAAWATGQSAGGAWITMRQDGQNHLSPNAGIPEAAAAGALGVRLGGGQFYQEVWIEKPALGQANRELEPEDILRAHRLLFAASGLALIAFVCVLVIWDVLFSIQ